MTLTFRELVEQSESARCVIILVEVGVAIALLEFLVVSLVVGGGTINGFMNGLVSGGLTIVAVVVLVWLATVFLVPIGPVEPIRPVPYSPEEE